MEKKDNFIDRTIYLIRKKLELNLSNDGTLEEMINKARELIEEIYK